ncbi:hypothetical protein [Paraburkholderia sp. SIMBA_027]|uniref:hypothetical protein n=1 Tax=Paraburkholderia sp. SIMBA_027 TaxID=3085770 RepID=UPI00397A7D08
MSKTVWAGAGGVLTALAAAALLPEIAVVAVAGAATVAVGTGVLEIRNRYRAAHRCQACGEQASDMVRLDWKWLAEAVRPTAEQVCPRCFHQGQWGAQYRRYEMAVDSADDVTTYSARYKGRVPNSVDQEIPVAGAWFLGKDDADKSLKVTAAYLGKNIVTQCKEERRSVGSTPVRSEWRYVGVAGCAAIR